MINTLIVLQLKVRTRIPLYCLIIINYYNVKSITTNYNMISISDEFPRSPTQTVPVPPPVPEHSEAALALS